MNIMSVNKSAYPVKVSVVLPTFNQSNYLISALQAILVNQVFADFELIVVDDGSTDETPNLLAQIKHPRLRVIQQANQGLPAALNAGFAIAKGEYLTWTSTDNVVAPTWLEELVQALDHAAPDVGYAFSYYAVIDDQDNVLYFNRDVRFDLPSLLMRNSGNASFLYRATLAKQIGPYDTNLMYAEDLDMWVRMAGVTQAVLVESVLYYYRQHANSMTVQQDKVRNATRGVVNKYLAKFDGLFDVDLLFPSIKLSSDQVFERWKSRIWLATIGAQAMFYCPVEALIDQLIKALQEKYDSGLVGNIVHLLVKEKRWLDASQVIEAYMSHDASDYLIKLKEIVEQQNKAELDKISFMTIDEKSLANDCSGDLTQKQLLRNLSTIKVAAIEISFEKVVVDLLDQLKDQKNHLEIWNNIAALKSSDEKKWLQQLRSYLTELIRIPQDPAALILLKLLESMCMANSGGSELAKIKLDVLIKQNPDADVLKKALKYLNKNSSSALQKDSEIKV